MLQVRDAAVTYVYTPCVVVALVPAAFSTVTSAAPVPAGASTVIVFADSTVKLDDATLPNSTPVAKSKLVPVTSTVAPP